MEPEDVAKSVFSSAAGKTAAIVCGAAGPVGWVAGAVIALVINTMMNDDHDRGNSDNDDG